jgi:hypothetical protein
MTDVFERTLHLLSAAGIQIELDELVQAVMASKARPARAVSKLLHDRGHKVDGQLLSRIGSLLKLVEYRLEERETINWDAGDFGDRGSCFWGGRAASRDNLSYGAPGFRAFTVYSGERGVARCLSFEIDGGRLFFNFYGLSLVEFRHVLARAGWELYPVDARYTGNAFYLNGWNEAGINALFTEPVEVLKIPPDYVEEVEWPCAVCYCPGATHQTSVGLVCAGCLATQFRRCEVCERMHPIADMVKVLSDIYVCRNCSPVPVEQLAPGAEGRYEAVLQVLSAVRTGVIPHGDELNLRRVALMMLNEHEQAELINEVELIADKFLEELARTDLNRSEWPFYGTAVAFARSAKTWAQAARDTANIRLRAEHLLDAVQRIRGELEDAPDRFAEIVRIPEIKISPLESELDGEALLAAIDRCAGLRNAVFNHEVTFSEAAEDIVFFARAARQLQLKAARNPLERFAMHYLADTADMAFVRLA